MKFVVEQKKDVLIILFYFLLTLIYFYKPITHPNYVLYPAIDMVTEHSWWRHFLIDQIKQNHTIPLWNDFEFSGNPFQANPSTCVFYPMNILFFFITPEFGFTVDFFIDIFIMGTSTYFFVKLLAKDRSAAFLSGLIALLGGTAVVRMYIGHVANFDSITWFPLLLYLFELQIATNKVKYAVLNSLVAALTILAGAWQLSFYALFSGVLYVLLRIIFAFFHNERINLKKQCILTSLVFILATGLSAIQIIPALEFAQYSVRNPKNYEYALSIALKPYHTIQFIYPHFFGSAQDSLSQWGNFSFPEFSNYSGAVAIFLVIAALFKIKNKYVGIFTIMLIFAYLYSIGKYGLVFPIFYHLPIFGSFRIPAGFLFVFAFAESVLAGFGFTSIIDFISNKDFSALKRLKIIYLTISIFAIVIFCLILGFAKTFIALYYRYLNTHYTARDIHNAHIFAAYSWIIKDALTFAILVGSFTILFILFISHRINKKLFLICTAFLIVIDLLNFDFSILEFKPYNEVYETTVSKDFYNYVGNNRVNDIDIRVVIGPYKLDTINGYDPLYLKNYRDFYFRAGDHSNDPFTLRAPFVVLQNVKNLTPFRLLNMKFVVANKKKDLDAFIPKNMPDTESKKVADYYVYQLNHIQPKAYLVPNAEVVPDFSKQLDTINTKGFDPNTLVVLENNFGFPLQNKPGQVNITSFSTTPNTVSVTAKTTQPAYLVLSEVWYPGWNVYVNNQHAQMLKANGIFRAVYIKKGTNHVFFSFEPISFRIGAGISILFICLYIGILIRFIYIKIR